MNLVTINFIECDHLPSNGYKVLWRILGSNDAYVDAGNFFTSPATFSDEVNPAGTNYEGFIVAEGFDTDCNQIAWHTAVISPPSQSGAGTYNLSLTSPCVPGAIYSNYLVSGGTPGDIVVVRVFFSGQMTKIGGNFVRADLSVSAPHGNYDATSSTCYSDSVAHGFNINVTTTITMASDTELVTVMAVVHNSYESLTACTVEIISINGNPVTILEIGCRGNSSTGGSPC